MQLEKTIRYLARHTYWQTLYNQAKEFNDLSILFENPKNLSDIQLYFLHWLRIYHSIYEDLANKESVYLDESVINNDIRCNAYLHYRRTSRDREMISYRNQKEVQKFKTRDGKIPGEMHQIDFRRKE